ncbi:MAG: SPFH domain-containing protein [Pirellula sp.]
MSNDNTFAPQIANNEWKPRTDEVAVRLYDKHLTGPSFIVPPTQTGTLVVDGKIQGRTVGKQDLKSYWSKFIPLLTKKTNTQLYLARNGLLNCEAIVPEAQSQDGHNFSVACSYQVEIDNFDEFFGHFFQASDVATTNSIEMVMRPTIAATINEFIRGATSGELVPATNEVLNRLADEIDARLRPIAKKYGIAVTHVMPPSYSSKSFEDLLDKKTKRRAELEDYQESHEYARRKLQIDQEAYEIERQIRELNLDNDIDDADFSARLEARKNEIKSKQIVQRLQVQEGIDRAVQQFKDNRRAAKVKQEDEETRRKNLLEDATLLRNHLLEKTALAKTMELEDLRHEYHLKLLQHQGVLTIEQLKQRQESYDRLSKLERQMLEDSLSNRSLQQDADRTKIVSDHELEIRIRRERDLLDDEVRRRAAQTDYEITIRSENFNRDLADRDQKSELERIRQLQEIQAARLQQQHQFHMDNQRHAADTQLKLRDKDIEEKKALAETRPRSDMEVLMGATPDQIRAAAEYRMAEQGHSAKTAQEKEAMYKIMIQSLELAQSQSPAQIAAMFKQQEELWKGMFDRLQKSGSEGVQAMKDVAMEMAKNQNVTVQMPSQPVASGNATGQEMLEYFKALMMAQANQPKS